MKKGLLSALILSTVFIASGQTADNFCGTKQTESDLSWLRNWQANYVPGEMTRGGSTYYIPTKVHIVGTDEGSGYYNLNYLYQAFCELNEHFLETGFHFYIFGDVNYIDNTDYYEHDWFDGSDMMQENNVNNLLNVYFVSDPAGNCGYFSPGDDGVAVAKSCAMPAGTTIAHEFGHFFSLPHTFYGWEWGTPDDSDQEWVNGDNCNSAADGFCDTPPDYLPYRWNCPGPEQTDPWGETFYSDGTLYMSYSNDACTGRFSPDQQEAMRDNLLGPRNNFLDWPEPAYAEITGTSTLVLPTNLSTELYYNNISFEWTPAAGATQYHLQISYSPSFSAVAKDVITSETSYLCTELEADKTYYWRVRPLAPANTCAPTSLANSFFTSTLEWSDVLNTDLFSSLTVYPNPASAGTEVAIACSAVNAMQGMVSISDLTGKLITEMPVQLVAGNNNLTMSIPQVSEGIYMMRITDGVQSETISLYIQN